MRIDGAIFDLDGTLLDSMFIWDTIGENYLLSRGITPKENLNETFKSMSLLQATQYYQSEYGLTDSTNEIMSGINKMIEHLYVDEVLLKNGVSEFLQQLKARNVRMCVATATDLHLVKAALERNGILKFFCDIFTCTEVGFGKDNPQIYLQALACLNTDKKYTYVFEDALYAVTTAKDAGFKVVSVYDESEANNTDIIKAKSDIYINTFTKMRDYLD